MACTLIGLYPPSMSQDDDGHREYRIEFLVYSDDKDNDGPYDVLQTPGIPDTGDLWELYGMADPLAWCRNNGTVTPKVKDDGKPEWWIVEKTFSTKPSDDCVTEGITDPLEEPNRISGGSNNYTEEGIYDMNGAAIVNSAHEPIRGPQNEWDASRFYVKIEQNVANLELELLSRLINNVNTGGTDPDAEMWGYKPRCIKFERFTWQIKYHGDCDIYYTRTLEFEIRPEGFDRNILDEGTKVLNGHWNQVNKEWVADNVNGSAPDPTNPNHFIRAHDPKGNPIRVILNGEGSPVSYQDNTIRWWCLNDGFNPFAFQGVCGEAADYAISAGLAIDGPWDSEAIAESSPGCDVGGYDDMIDGEDLDCSANGVPGRILVKKYRECNFFLNLNIPTDISQPLP